ncbi:hypothetical protein PFISCL1PPCAC_12113, partial [Pristionchus fissidentatus]
LHRGNLESDGFHWCTVATTGQLPDKDFKFSVYDSQESRLYLEEWVEEDDTHQLHVLDLKSMNWQKMDTFMDDGPSLSRKIVS